MRLAFLPEMDAFLCPPLSHILIFFVILTLKTIISNNSRGKKKLNEFIYMCVLKYDCLNSSKRNGFKLTV